jgi:hypothetical protein
MTSQGRASLRSGSRWVLTLLLWRRFVVRQDGVVPESEAAETDRAKASLAIALRPLAPKRGSAPTPDALLICLGQREESYA